MTLSSMRATAVQFATGGRWESAAHFALNARGTNLMVALDWIAANRASREIAIEVLFSSRHGLCLVGARFRGRAIERATTFTNEMFTAGGPRGWREVVQTLAANVGPVFRARDLQALELGVLNAWKSHPVSRVWTSMDGPLKSNAVWERIAAAPATRQSQRGPLLLETSFGGPLEHWTGSVVSTLRSGAHRPSRARVRAAIALVGSTVAR